MLILGGFFALFAFLFLNKQFSKKQKLPEGLKAVPLVGGCLPVLGHFFKVNPETLPQFIQQCCERYGKIFKIKFLNQTWVVLCDKKFYSEFYNASENQLSVYKTFKRLYVLPALNTDEAKVEKWMAGLRQTMSKGVFIGRCPGDKELCEIMFSESLRVVSEMKKEARKGAGIDLRPLVQQHSCSIVSQLLFGVTFSRKLGESFRNLIKTMNNAVECATYFPHFVVRFLFQKKLDGHIAEITAEFNTCISEHKTDQTKKTYPFLRFLADLRDSQTESELSITEIGGIISHLLFLSSECPGTIILTLLNILTRPEVLTKVRNEVTPIVENGSWTDLLDIPFLHGCIMETARLGCKPGVSYRTPADGMKSISGYYIGDADFITVAANLHHLNGNSFLHGEQFCPEKYRDRDSAGNQILTWGAGTHKCPGNILAVKMTKMLVSILLTKINFDDERTFIGKADLFSNSAVMEYEHKVFIRKDK